MAGRLSPRGGVCTAGHSALDQRLLERAATAGAGVLGRRRRDPTGAGTGVGLGGGAAGAGFAADRSAGPVRLRVVTHTAAAPYRSGAPGGIASWGQQ